jgi:hypothetical protein
VCVWGLWCALQGMLVQQCTDSLRKAIRERNYEDAVTFVHKAEQLEMKSPLVDECRDLIRVQMQLPFMILLVFGSNTANASKNTIS